MDKGTAIHKEMQESCGLKFSLAKVFGELNISFP